MNDMEYEENAQCTIEPLFTVNTEYTYEAYVKYSRTVSNKISHVRLRVVILFILMMLIAIMGYFIKNEELMYIFLLAGVLFPFVLYLKQKRAMKKMWESNKGTQNITARYTFFEDHFEQHNELGDSKFQYQNLYKVIEGKTAFYLMISKGQGVIIDKAACDEKNSEFIRSIKAFIK